MLCKSWKYIRKYISILISLVHNDLSFAVNNSSKLSIKGDSEYNIVWKLR